MHRSSSGRKFVRSPTSRSSWSRASPPRPSSPSKMRGCLTALRQRTDELGQLVEELRALGEISQAVNSTLDLQTVLSTIVAKAVQLSGTEAGAIYVFDEAQREFRLRATYGMDQELIDALGASAYRPRRAECLPRRCAQREPIQVADLAGESRTPMNDDHAARRLPCADDRRRCIAAKTSSAYWSSVAARPALSRRTPSTW